MFVSNTHGAILLHSNRPNDVIDWRLAVPGGTIARLSEDDFTRAHDWVNAGHYTGAVAPAPVSDAEGRAPNVEGWTPTFDEGTPARWELLGNTMVLEVDGTVCLLDPDGQTKERLSGELLQALT